MSEDVATLGAETMEPAVEPNAPGPSHNPFADESSGEAPSRWRRTIDAETRKAMNEAAALLKADGGSAAIDDDEMEAVGAEPEPERPRPGTAPAPVVTAAAPAPQLDADVLRLKQEYDQRFADLDKREQAIAQREVAGDTARARDTYIDKPVQWWKDSLKTFGLGELDENEYKRETADLINELSDSIGVPISPATKALMEQRRAVKYVRADKQLRAQRDKQESESREKARVDGEWANAAITLTTHLTGEAKAKYPYLATVDRPGEAVVSIIRRASEREGKQLTWQEASKQADDYLKSQVLTSYDKVKHLLNAAPGKPGDAASAGTQVAQGDPSGIRRSRTLSNAQAASAPTQPNAPAVTAVVKGKWSKEAHRKNTLAVFRERVKADE